MNRRLTGVKRAMSSLSSSGTSLVSNHSEHEANHIRSVVLIGNHIVDVYLDERKWEWHHLIYTSNEQIVWESKRTTHPSWRRSPAGTNRELCVCVCQWSMQERTNRVWSVVFFSRAVIWQWNEGENRGNWSFPWTDSVVSIEARRRWLESLLSRNDD